MTGVQTCALPISAGVGMRPILIDRRGRFPGFTQAPRITTMAELPGVLGL